MSEFMIKAVSLNLPDPVKDMRGAYKKGDIVEVREDGFYWGDTFFPKFVLVKVPGLELATVRDKRDEWEFGVRFEIVATNAALDGARIRLYAEYPGPANIYGLTYAKLEGWIERIGGTLVSQSSNDVRFDITVQGIYTSEAFWGADPGTVGIIITETNYVQGTGIHTADVDISNSSVSLDKAVRRIEKSLATIVAVNGDTITIEVARSDVRDEYIDRIDRALRKTIRRRRYGISESDVDMVMAAGGTITITASQLADAVIDRAV